MNDDNAQTDLSPGAATTHPTLARVLVVDDNEMNRDMLSRRLRRSGFTVLEADDGEPALAVAMREPIDLIVLDVMMPGMDGLSVLRTLRRIHPPEQLPVIMATAKGESSDIVEALELGANDHVTKPIDFQVLLARIHAQLRMRRPAGAGSGAARDDAAPVATGAAASGTLLAERYTLETQIGHGSFGVVWRARHRDLDRPVAIKLMHTGLTSDERALERFRREGHAASRIDHPNAVQIFDFGVGGDGTAYLVMELLRGHSLQHELIDHGALPLRRCMALMLPICDALAAAHGQGLVHRDIKPENIFLHENEHGTEVVKVLDFGIAKALGGAITAANLTSEGAVLGTPAYMSPERLRGEPYDGRADVYSLGLMLYQMLTGQRAFSVEDGDPMALAIKQLSDPMPRVDALHADIPAAVDDLLQSAAAKAPVERPDVRTFAARLAALADALPSDALDATFEPLAAAASTAASTAPSFAPYAPTLATPGVTEPEARAAAAPATRVLPSAAAPSETLDAGAGDAAPAADPPATQAAPAGGLRGWLRRLLSRS
ncbi:MAG: response regulator [Acidobacteriota bacterium]